ncbi:acetoacetate decarboxylase family protein [Nocardioides sp.]|uniref:acetoacetate decarboxylase family protein n=1 Tax=Nocardioides sp. TaxID=35761 RepID=UPI002D7FE541|nr:acetoacetate decarboxylase family protein [Nocardioides sp.]HET8959797.1 acetoacetate decarboxylase family protein [Nocardioides sp.]
MGYPSPPWQMQGQLWLSLFRVRGVEGRPDGVYGAAFVSYEPGSELTYSELLVARPAPGPGRAVEITDIWVDSPESMEGGRELWAIPKGLCDFTSSTRRGGVLSHAGWSATITGRPIARATFGDVSRFAPRLPFRGGTRQPALAVGEEPKVANLHGSGRTLPCRGRWEFEVDGPLGWLAGRRALASFRMSDFEMSFG